MDAGLISGAGDFGFEFPPGSGEIRFFGTSAAAPHIAAVAALLLQANLELSPAQIKATLQGTAVDLGVPGPDNIFGAGRVDALAATQRVMQQLAEAGR